MKNQADAQLQLEQLAEELRRGEMRGFKKLYLEHKEPFMIFARKYSQDEELLKDIYQESMIVAYENIMHARITEMRSSMKTYLFSIGKFTLFNSLRKSQKDHSMEPLTFDRYAEKELSASRRDLTDEEEIMLLHFRKLGESCRELLRMFYYNNFSIEVIMHRMNYKNENTVKAHKSRCMKMLKESIQLTKK